MSRLDQAKRLMSVSAAEAAPPIDDEGQPLVQIVRGLNVAELVELVDFLKTSDGEPRSIGLYKAWIALSAHKTDQLFAAWYNLGVQLLAAGNAAEGAIAFRTALAAKPDLHQAAVNAGLCHEQVGDAEGALKLWTQVLQPDDIRTALLNHCGRLLENLKRYDEAEAHYVRSLLTVPTQEDVIHHWIGVRAKICAWPVFCDAIPGLTRQSMMAATGALSLLALTDDIEMHDKANAAWIAKKMPPVSTRLSPVEGYAHRRLRIGYLSSDLCRHPMAYLVAELFELHDREAFEIYGYCSTKEDGSEVRRRIVASFDKFTSVIALTDEALAQAIRADEIDILIDLNGLTLGTRLQALRWRPAPVQMTYLGYNGSIPFDELDYILADRYVIRPEEAEHHRPAPLYLPSCYQVNDRLLDVASGQTRAEAGLPDDRFVFCCFSNSYKITEEMFAAWVEILRRAPLSVLWLFADNEPSRRNLASRVAESGIDPDRVIFAARVEPAAYRGRLALADLFLDTFPYNSGTTASDALRAGLPIVTLSGRSFVSRMAGSLLHAIGLNEGVTTSRDAYIDLAVALATDPRRQSAFRDAVGGGAWARSLGDTPRFARDLEALLASVAVRRTEPAAMLGREDPALYAV